MKNFVVVFLFFFCTQAFADRDINFIPSHAVSEHMIIACSGDQGLGVTINKYDRSLTAEVYQKVIVGNPAGIHTSYFEHVRTIPVKQTSRGSTLIFVGDDFSLGILIETLIPVRLNRGLMKMVAGGGDRPVSIEENVICQF
jgi:hypothetical protein